ncbi:MAG TPA: hypothetical protein DD827_04730 [Gammaproteobacteria bacterium]|jgi:polysaccharide deacetylase 2 family uncharacterized protein YibQ|nr:hypothetical protein [Gammaproteobacteria bacterium]
MRAPLCTQSKIDRLIEVPDFILRPVSWFFWLALLVCTLSSAHAGSIAVIIDDIGYNQHYGEAAASLHPNIALSVLPDAPFALQLADNASQNGNEVMLHIPMQAMTSPSPHESKILSMEMGETRFKSQLRNYLDRFPAITGVNNHMGSRLTRDTEHMGWFMEVMNEYPGLFFVDSRTHHKTVAAKIASEYFVSNTSRDIFLDSKPNDSKELRVQLKRLLKKAEEQGFALAIAHPYPETIKSLRQFIPQLEALGHQLIPISQFIEQQDNQLCPECSSPWLKVVKNSKP